MSFDIKKEYLIENKKITEPLVDGTYFYALPEESELIESDVIVIYESFADISLNNFDMGVKTLLIYR